MKIKKYYILSSLLISCHLHNVKNSKYDLTFPLEKKFSLKQTNKSSNNYFWYKNFNNQELNKLISEALENNFSLKKAWSRLYQAQWRAKIAGAKLHPNINLSANKSFRDNNNSNNNSNNNFNKNNQSVALILKWELDLWKKIKNLKSKANLTYRAEENDLQNTALILSSSIAKTYFSLQTEIIKQKISQEQILIAHTVHKILEHRKAVGIGNITSLQTSKKNYLQAKINLSKKNQKIEELQHLLAILIGKSPISYKYLPKNKIQDLPALPALPLPKNLIKNNSFLKSSFLNLKIADYQIAIDLANQYPSFTINTDYSISNNNNSFDIHNFILRISVNIIKTLYDGGTKKYNHRLSKEKFQQQLNLFNSNYLEVIQNIEDALSQEKYIKEQLIYSNQQVQLLEKIFELSQEFYIHSEVNLKEIFNDLNNQKETKRKTANLKNNLLNARISLYLALGNCIIETKFKEK